MLIKKIIPSFIKDAYTTITYNNFIKHNKYKILNDSETIRQIIENKKSIARFGDGELKWILNIKQDSFQDASEELSKKLKEVLNCRYDNLLLCIPEGIQRTSEYTNRTEMFWKNFVRWYKNDIIKYIDKDYCYGNTNFTRWYIEYKDKESTKEKLEQLKKIWNDKQVVIIEGKDTKMGIGNDLFDNSRQIERIIAPSKNAFSKYKAILEEAKKIDKEKLILIALGPTATILAYDLAKAGYQALDVGHIDIEYEWYKRNAKSKILIPGKYVNEMGGIEENINQNNKMYEKSIIKKII